MRTEKIELDELKKLAESVVAAIDEMDSYQQASERLSAEAVSFERDFQETSAKHHAELTERQRELDRLAETISMEPRARIKAIESSRYSHLYDERLRKLREQLAATPETDTERQYSRLAREPVRIGKEEYDDLNNRLTPLMQEDTRIQRAHKEICKRLGTLSGKLGEQIHEVLMHEYRYLASNRLADDEKKLKRMRAGETPSPRRGG